MGMGDYNDAWRNQSMGMATTIISGGAAGAHTVTGIKPGMELVSVWDNNAGTIVDLTAEFTITADDTIDNTGGTVSTSLIVQWFTKL